MGRFYEGEIRRHEVGKGGRKRLINAVGISMLQTKEKKYPNAFAFLAESVRYTVWQVVLPREPSAFHST